MSHKKFRSFPSHCGASVAILFALMLPLLLVALAIGFDASRAHFIQVRLQQAVDQAALAGVSSEGTAAERKAIAENVFAANYGTGIFAPPVTVSVDVNVDGSVDVGADASMKSPFASFSGHPELIVHSESSASKGFLDVEVVLIADVSGSMRSTTASGVTHIQALRDAGKVLLDTLQTEVPANVNVRAAIVPFVSNVNVGTNNSSFVSNTDHPLFKGTSWAGCVQERKPPYHITNDYNPGAIDGSGEWHAFIWPPEPDTPVDGWAPCLNASDGTNSGYALVEESTGPDDLYTQGPNYNCVRQPIEPLTSDWAVLETRMAGLVSASNYSTIIVPGVSWGLRVLTPGEPFPEAADFSPTTKKIMIVLTDGAQEVVENIVNCPMANNSNKTYRFNPRSLGLSGDKLSGQGPVGAWTAYGYIQDSDPFKKAPMPAVEQVDELLIAACDKTKNAGADQGGSIEIYTILFGSASDPTSRIAATMKACASSTGHYAYAPDAQDLEDVFADIGNASLSTSLTR